MQTNEQRMTEQDILALANALAIKMIEPIKEQLGRIEQKLDESKPEDQTDLIWRNAKDVARNLNNGKGIPLSTARKLIAMPNFPKNIYGKRDGNSTGPWRASEVIQFFKVNKSKV